MSPASSTATWKTTRKSERGRTGSPVERLVIRRRCRYIGRIGPAGMTAGTKRRPVPSGFRSDRSGAIAQLGERFNGIEEVVGSIPSGSTNQIRDLRQLNNLN
jgi:hypothetical protein